MITPLLSALLLSSALLPDPEIEPQRPDLGAPELDTQVFHDVDQQGDLWARGAHWKMRFGPEGATFLPLFGPGQERHHPLALTPAVARLGACDLPLDRSAAPVRSGDRVAFDRGLMREVYDLAPEGVEQSFVFPVVPRGDDLLLALDTGTDLPGGPDSLGGVEFDDPLGRLAYSQAVAVDGLGRRLPLETRLDGATLSIHVPAWYLELAAAPLVIDPWLGTIPVDASSHWDLSPDVSFDASSQRWLVVWERADEGTDSDVLYRFFDDNGAPLSSGYLNLDTEHWVRPAVANLNAKNVFYAVAEVAKKDSTVVKGRVLSATAAPGSSGGPVYQLSQPTSFTTKIIDSWYPQVGGDPSPLASHGTFCVVWEEHAGPSSFVRFRRVNGKGVPVGTEATALAEGSVTNPGISASNDGSAWTVAFGQADAGTWHLMLAGIGWDGVVTQTPQAVEAGLSGPFKVSSTVAGKVLVGSKAGYYNVVALYAIQGTQLLDTFYVDDEQVDSLDLAVDGERFLLGYQKSGCARGATLTIEPVANQIAIIETFSALCQDSGTPESGLATRHEAGGTAGEALQTWAGSDMAYPYDPDVLMHFLLPH